MEPQLTENRDLLTAYHADDHSGKCLGGGGSVAPGATIANPLPVLLGHSGLTRHCVWVISISGADYTLPEAVGAAGSISRGRIVKSRLGERNY